MVLPKFIEHYLNSSFAKNHFNRVVKGVGVPDLHLENLSAMLIPAPTISQQLDLIKEMNGAWQKYRAKLAEADELLAGLDSYVLDTLGLTLPPKDERKVFAVLHSDLNRRQIGANLYAPPLSIFFRALSSSKFPVRKLREEVAINPAIHFKVIDENLRVSFIPMDAVEDQAAGGVKLQSRVLSEVKKGYTAFSEGDVLWAKITPCMENGKSCIAKGLENGIGFGSTEFHVLRPLSNRVTAEYVHEFISQPALRRVARFAFTGSAGHQRVPAEFLAELPFPVPPPDVQERIAAEARRRRDEARRLRAEAEVGWQAAKRWFEAMLLGESA